MRKFRFAFGLLIASIALGVVIAEYDGILTGSGSIFAKSKISSKYETPMHKTLFTQRGYIQFLRWELPVPEIEEFTFCLWVKSTNLTYSHSIFSYSKNEEKRLVSSWISPFGRSVHLEIGETQIMAHPTNLEEHRWYHICQSWENQLGLYALWINGYKEVEGYASQLRGHVIPSGGDIVVGQEYTDFDKGFEEGIEGAVLGFNLLLSSAFDKSNNFPSPIIQGEKNLDSLLSLGDNRVPGSFGLTNGIKTTPYLDLGHEIHPEIQLRRNDQGVLGFPPRFSDQELKILNENQEGMFDSTLKEYLGGQELFDKNLARRGIAVKIIHRSKRASKRLARIEPLGLQLIDLSYNRCEIGRGSPFIGGSKMLISWTRTPVKVFGGAIVKNAKNTCGDF